ncbi:hypothetical protein LIER_10157 [Lithospermum erythrorhizon]|uniref:Uncharacterized protein n=1 Tax=Lithospermum erythrorhizon TaxID=34254 RepID=A0AAV3PKA2_LITER
MEFILIWGNVRAISILIPGSSNEDVPGELNRAFCRVRPRKMLLSVGSQRGRSDPKRLSYPSLVLAISVWKSKNKFPLFLGGAELSKIRAKKMIQWLKKAWKWICELFLLNNQEEESSPPEIDAPLSKEEMCERIAKAIRESRGGRDPEG